MANFVNATRPCFTPLSLTIPTAFAESYSYAEMVCYLYNLIKNLEDRFNTNNEDILNYIDQQIENLKNYTDNLVGELREEEKQDIENLKNYFIEELTNLKNYVDEQDNLTYQNSINYLRTIVDDNPPYLVLNPVTNSPDTLQSTLNMLYETIRFFGLTASEYDYLALTATEYDSKNVTATNYDLYSKLIFWYKFYCVYSGFTGERVSHQQALNEITQYLRNNGVTAATYDILEKTVTEYDNLEITGYNYDWNGINLLM